MTNQFHQNKSTHSAHGQTPDDRESLEAQLTKDSDGENNISALETIEKETPFTIPPKKPGFVHKERLSSSIKIMLAIALMSVGLYFDLYWIGLLGCIIALWLSLLIIFPLIQGWFAQYLTPQERKAVIGMIGFIAAITGLAKYFGVYSHIDHWLTQFKYDEFGSWADWVGALGQISIAVLAVYVAWQQYVISRDLTMQQNLITQQQTIDSYFQGITELTVNEEGLLEDWPQERAIIEGRTAAILSSVDAAGKAKIIRFLSKSRLVTPLMRDTHLGRPLLDGAGGYAEDRDNGVRVIDLGVMLAATNLSRQDLRWTDLSGANMVRADLSLADLVRANLSRTILYEADLTGADLKGVRLYYGSVETATPRSRHHRANYETGVHTGVVLERANLTGVKNLSEEQRYYCCCWCGEKTRATIPGGCEGIPNKLGR